MSLPDDNWIKTHNELAPEKYHSLGYITFAWNSCEYQLFELFCLTFGLPPKLAWIIVHEMGDITLMDRIRTFLKIGFSEPIVIADDIATILNALDAYDICRLNRNTFVHFRLRQDEKENRIALARVKGPTLDRHPFPDSLEDMRRVGDEIWGLNIHLTLINRYLRNHGTAKAVPLPQKVLLPELIWKPPQTTAPKPPRPPKPSRGSRWKAAVAKRESEKP